MDKQLVKKAQTLSLTNVAAAISYCVVGLHEEIMLHIRFDVKVGAFDSYCEAVLHCRRFAQTEFDVDVAACNRYCVAGKLQMVLLVQIRFDVAVDGFDSNSIDTHKVRKSQMRSDVAVGAIFSY